MLDRVEKMLSEIRTTLLNDDTVRKLLYCDSENCLSMDAPAKAVVEDYITLYPIYQFQNRERYEQNGMVNIVVPTITVDGDSNYISGVVQVQVAFNIDRWTLTNNKIRPLELSNRIIALLNNKKFSISNPLELSIINDLVVSKQVVGYALLFDFVDGNSIPQNF